MNIIIFLYFHFIEQLSQVPITYYNYSFSFFEIQSAITSKISFKWTNWFVNIRNQFLWFTYIFNGEDIPYFTICTDIVVLTIVNRMLIFYNYNLLIICTSFLDNIRFSWMPALCSLDNYIFPFSFLEQFSCFYLIQFVLLSTSGIAQFFQLICQIFQPSSQNRFLEILSTDSFLCRVLMISNTMLSALFFF